MRIEQPKPAVSEPPVHYLSALVTIILDWLWGVPELTAEASVVGLVSVPLFMLATGGTCFIAVTMIQHFVAGDGWGKSIAKGLVMGIIAGIPIMVAGTAVGGILVGWAGVGGLTKMLARRNDPPQQLPPRTER